MRYLSMLLMLVSGFAMAGSSDKIDREFDLATGGEVTLKNINGSVVIHGWDKSNVRVVAIKKARGSNAAGKMERTEVRIDATSDRIDIETFRTTKAKKWNNNVSVKYELWVPHEVEINARTTNGSVKVYDINGNLNARTTNGSVTLEGVEGSVNAHTTNGNVTASLLAYNGGEMDLPVFAGGPVQTEGQTAGRPRVDRGPDRGPGRGPDRGQTEGRPRAD